LLLKRLKSKNNLQLRLIQRLHLYSLF